MLYNLKTNRHLLEIVSCSFNIFVVLQICQIGCDLVGELSEFSLGFWIGDDLARGDSESTAGESASGTQEDRGEFPGEEPCIDDVALTRDRGVLKVRRGSRGSNRELPLNPTCHRALSDWIAHRAKLCAEKGLSTDALWVSRLRRPIASKSLSSVVKRVGAAAGLDAISPLVLRNTLRACADRLGNPPVGVLSRV